jgi:hypothetical protein
MNFLIDFIFLNNFSYNYLLPITYISLYRLDKVSR